MRSAFAGLSTAQRAEAVAAFNARFGEMDQALWCLSKHCRPALLAGRSTEVVETLVWTLKSWWGVQGVRSQTKAQMAEALIDAVHWSNELFDSATDQFPATEAFAVDSVTALVERSMALGVPRREYSLASKVLHWLLPWRVPVYDSYVRRALGVPTSWDHPQAYRLIVHEVFAMTFDASSDLSWAGSVEPVSPLHALDKCLWWLGGGEAGNAALVRDPWRLIDGLGLGRC